MNRFLDMWAPLFILIIVLLMKFELIDFLWVMFSAGFVLGGMVFQAIYRRKDLDRRIEEFLNQK